MIAVCLSPLYVLLNLYVLRWLFRWMAVCHPQAGRMWVRVLAGFVYAFLALALPAGFFLPSGLIRRIMKLIGNYWLGVTLYMLLAVAIADALRLFLKGTGMIDRERLCSRETFVFAGAVCILVIAAVSIYGVLNARVIHTTDYEIAVDKDGGAFEELNVVLIADLHLGYNIGCARMENMVKQVNRADADLIVIAGDIFDNEYEALEDPGRLAEILRGMKSRYGVYACYGNHDVEEAVLAGFTFGGNREEKASDPRMDAFLEAAGIRLLRDEYALIENRVYVYGRPDAERPGRGIVRRRSPEEITEGMDLSKPVLVIDHQPKELQELADAGVDADLCGHTHDGQMFPGNLLARLMWENACGYLRKDGMHNIVTSGVGLFGPNMRVGTAAEICRIKMQFRPD